jgi:type II secretory pathway pseudopilin PulG
MAGPQESRAKETASMVGIVVGCLLFLLVLAIIMPCLLRSRPLANEASALGSLRTYNLALIAYLRACPGIGYPASLEKLGPGGKDCSHADLVEGSMAMPAPTKNGYRFFYTTKNDFGGLTTKYSISADPITPGTTGVRHFFTDETGVMRSSPTGSADANSEPFH